MRKYTDKIWKSVKKARKILVAIKNSPWCDKTKSLCLSIKYDTVFIVAPQTEVVIEKGANILIENALYFNKPWHGKQKSSASLYVNSTASFIVDGAFTFFSGANVSVNNGATLHLGNGYMNLNGNIACFKSIKIGNNATLSEEVIIRDSNNHTIVREGYTKTQPIVIGDKVWVGLRAVILKGVNIGANSIIAAGAVVNKSVPPNTLYGGVPAKCIHKNVIWK